MGNEKIINKDVLIGIDSNKEDNLDNRDILQLTKALEAAKYTTFKAYLDELKDMDVVEPTIPNILTKDSIRLLEIKKITKQKNEDMIQKLTTVYNAVLSTGASIIVMIDAIRNKANKVYIGIRHNSLDKTSVAFQTLEAGMDSQFPGTEYKRLSPDKGDIDNVLDAIFEEDKNTKTVSSVSTIAAIRSKDQTENKGFIQGIERLMNAMHDRSYTAVFIADPITTIEKNQIRSGIEKIYSTISPFEKSTWSYNQNDSASVMESLASSIGTSITEGTSWTQSHTVSKSKGKGIVFNSGVHASFAGIIGGSIGTALSHSDNDATSDSDGKAGHTDKTKNKNETKTKASTDTKTKGRTLQIQDKNKSISEILQRLDMQLKRMRESEDFGLFNCGAYFIADDTATSLLAANTYRALMLGEGSSAEMSSVNTWKSYNQTKSEDDAHNDKRTIKIIKYLRHIQQPIFAKKWMDAESEYMPFSAATMVSGLELPLHLGLPMSSVPGIDVVEHATFGRNVKHSTECLKMGRLYHMGKTEERDVFLNKNSLASHTFITGSTGSGKSNTVYHLISELSQQKIDPERDENIKFLVIEPAKGEYKEIFGQVDDVYVYGTNPHYTEILRINPFSFPEKIHIYEHLDRLVEIFNACWPMYAAMPAVLKDAIERAYVACGWDMKRSKNKYGDLKLFPVFEDVLYQIKNVINESQYSDESKGDYIGALTMRLHSLSTGINNMIFTSDEISSRDLFDENVIVDLSRIGSVETKSLIMGLLVMKQQEYRMSQAEQPNAPLRHITVLEEAHNLLKRTSTEQSSESSNLMGKSVEMLANSIAEMRTYGEGFIIVDQSPGLMDMSVIRNTNTKIILRLPDYYDRELVGRASGLNNEQINELSKLECGVASIYQNDWIEAVLCKVDAFDIENKNSETNKKSIRAKYIYDGPDGLISDIIELILGRRNNIEDVDIFRTDVAASTLGNDIKVAVFEYLNLNNNDDEQLALEATMADRLFNSSELMRIAQKCDNIEDWEILAETSICPSLNYYSQAEKGHILHLILTGEVEKNIEYRPIYEAYSDLQIKRSVL